MFRRILIAAAFCLALPLIADDRADLDAITALEAEIESLVTQSGPFSADLFEPVMQLARLQLNFGQHEEALDSLQRAQNIAHRNEGVYTPTQLPIISLLTNLALDDEEYDDANRMKRFAFFVAKNTYEPESPELLNAYAQLADWYMNTGQARRAKSVIKDAIEVADASGQDSLRFNVLENKARRLDGNCCNPKKLVAAIDDTVDDILPETLSAVYLEIADTLILGGRAKRAAPYFAQANAIAPLNSPAQPLAFRRALENPLSAQTETFEVMRNRPLSAQQRLRRLTRDEQLEEPDRKPQWFLFDPDGNHKGFKTRDIGETYDREKRTYAMVGHPILFSEDQLDALLPFRWQNNKEELRVEMSFTVTETGDLEDIELIDSNAPLRLNRLISRILRKTYYRPAFKDGQPVASTGVTLTQTFLPRVASQ